MAKNSSQVEELRHLIQEHRIDMGHVTCIAHLCDYHEYPLNKFWAKLQEMAKCKKQ